MENRLVKPAKAVEGIIAASRVKNVIARCAVQGFAIDGAVNDPGRTSEIEGQFHIGKGGQIDIEQVDAIHAIEIDIGIGAVKEDAVEVGCRGVAIGADINHVAFSEIEILDGVVAVTGSEHEAVAIIATDHVVVSGTAGQGVIAAGTAAIRAPVTRQEVVTAAAIDHVIAVDAREPVSA